MHLVIGAGITGLSAAAELAAAFGDQVLVIEKNAWVGGLAATLPVAGRRFDLGSHRVHPSFDARILARIADCCEGRLLERPRNGRIRINDRFLPYPPSMLDILKGFGAARTARLTAGMAAAELRSLRRGRDRSSFAAYARSCLGTPLYELFYAPYARKLWARDPESLSFEPAEQRLQRNFPSELLRKNLLPRRKRFLYPEGGIGCIAEGLRRKVLQAGGRCEFCTRPVQFNAAAGRITEVVLEDAERRRHEVPVDTVTWTAPLPDLLALTRGGRLEGLAWRALRLLFFSLAERPAGDVETYYFPSPALKIGRMSEIAKYSSGIHGADGERTVTLEVPCTQDDEFWRMPAETLAAECLAELEQLGVLTPSAGARLLGSHNLEMVYPVYEIGWRQAYKRTIEPLASLGNLLLTGRAPLFLHCNIDHCMEMGERAGRFLAARGGETAVWREHSEEFAAYCIRE